MKKSLIIITLLQLVISVVSFVLVYWPDLSDIFREFAGEVRGEVKKIKDAVQGEETVHEQSE